MVAGWIWLNKQSEEEQMAFLVTNGAAVTNANDEEVGNGFAL